MKQQATTRDPSDKEGSSSSQPRPARRDSSGGRESQYDLRVSYYATMKPQRVYPLVVEVAHGSAVTFRNADTDLHTLHRFRRRSRWSNNSL